MTKDELDRIAALKRAWEEGTLRKTLARAPESGQRPSCFSTAAASVSLPLFR